MSASKRGDRTRLDGFEIEIFKLVQEHATSGQWREWLRAPLEHAAADGNMDLFTRLIDAGANGSAGWRGCHGRTLLGAAAHNKGEKMVRSLLRAGAKPDLDVMFGAKPKSALHVAARRGAEKTFGTLLLAGADPNVLDGDKEGPLHVAADSGRQVMVNNLLLRGALPNAKTRRGQQTPLHLAASKGHALCVSSLLVGGADKDSRDFQGYSPLHLAARGNHLGIVEELLTAGASFEVRGVYSRYAAIDMAAEHGHAAVVRVLVQNGSSATSCDEAGFTALHRTADSTGAHLDRGDVIRVLLEAGANIDAMTEAETSTTLHVAASQRYGSNGTTRALLEGGANMESRDVLVGDTPLHKACSNSCVGAVRLLLSWGADEKLTNDDGETMEDMLGQWEGEEGEDELRKEGDQRIRHMLARAPADRSWRRRGWLVLARSCPAKVQLVQDIDVRGSTSDNSAKIAKASDGSGDSGRDETADLARLLGRVVGLDADGLFRLVVGFL